MYRIINRLLKWSTLGILVGVFGLSVLYMQFEQFSHTPIPFKADDTYHVAPQSGIGDLAREMERRGVLDKPSFLVWLARFLGKAHRIKAGEYSFAPNLTPMEVLNQLVEGRVLRQHLTIVEGWTFRQMMNAIHNHPKITHTLTGLSDEQIMTTLGHPGEHPEGRFFPDTYPFSGTLTDVALLQRAYEAMSKRLETSWRDRAPNLPYRRPYEALIMASIVEKEAALPSERAEIAGVFTRRLQQGIPLATDPTVIYGLGSNYDGNLRKVDLLTDGPYNTYMRLGLPPTPIALTGAEALHAALHPAPGTTLYFVARGDGSHQFSTTLAQHNAAVRHYQLKGAPWPNTPRATTQALPSANTFGADHLAPLPNVPLVVDPSESGTEPSAGVEPLNTEEEHPPAQSQ